MPDILPEDATDEDRSRAYPWYVLAVLFLVYLINFADRHLVSVLLEPMKQDLGATDTQMGLLTGIAFALFYVVFGLPVAMWADRGIRRSILAIGIAAWSLFTMTTGLGRTFAQVLVARIGVGVGESSAGAPVHSLLSDYFPPAQRATALAIYTAGAQVGAMVGIMLGGFLSDAYGWRTAFFVFGASGLPLALLVRFTVDEPQRGRFEGGVKEPTSSLSDAIRLLRKRRSYLIVLAADALLIAASYGASTWHPTFLRRVHGMSGTDAGFWVGLVNIAAFTGGILCAVAADRLSSRDLRWYLWLPALASVLAFPMTIAFPLVGDASDAIFMLAFWSFLTGSIQGPIYAMVQSVATPSTRALAAAILLFAMSLIGLGLGPTLVGVASDQLTARFGDDALRYALLVVAPVQLLGAGLCVLAARSVRADAALAGSSTGA